MLYRLAAAAIVAFWLVMSGLLIRLEVRPDQSAILDVPPSYVLRVMLKNGQQSLLSLQQGDLPIGTISLRPHGAADDRRSLDFSGNFLVPAGGMPMPRQRAGISGALHMDKALKVETFELEATLQQPHYRLAVQGDIPRGYLKYQLYLGDRQIGGQPLPLETSAIVSTILQAAGLEIDPGALPLMQSNFATPALSSREARISLHGEEVDVFQLSMLEGGVPVATLYISQLGQIVKVTTNFGYSLVSQDFR